MLMNKLVKRLGPQIVFVYDRAPTMQLSISSNQRWANPIVRHTDGLCSYGPTTDGPIPSFGVTLNLGYVHKAWASPFSSL